MGDSDRAVSDLVGFAGTFAVIVTAVLLISTAGVGALGELQHKEQRNNAQQAFEIAAQNFGAIENGNAPKRTSELDLHDGRLRVESNTRFDIHLSSGVDTSITPQSLVFQQGDTKIAYESGGIFRTDSNGGGIMEHAPGWVCTEDRAILSFVRLEAPTGHQLGSGVVQVAAVRNETRLLYPLNRTGPDSATDADAVSVTVANSPFERSWRNHFTKSNQHWSVSGNTITCDVSTDGAIYVRETVVNVTLKR
ncbi:MAG: hypothetical protein ABEJ31_00530 [Haloarculaceae archaeon]